MTTERTISIDTLILEVYQDENTKEHIRVMRKGLQNDFPVIDFARGDEAAAFPFIKGVARLCGVEIQRETKNESVVPVDKGQDNPVHGV